MNCLKCGAETTAQNVFCDACRQDMARHPVPKDAAAVLPNREHQHTPRKAFSQPNAEQQVITLGRRVRRQRLAIWILSLVCALLLAAGTFFALGYGKDYPRIGQNYTSTTAPSSSPSDPSSLP